MEQKMRCSNVELLRIISMLGVIILHYNNGDIGGGFVYATSVNKYILEFIEGVCICAVNVYILISGYFLCQKKERSWKKPMKLIYYVVLYNLVMCIAKIILGDHSLTMKEILQNLLPAHYFVILYGACYMVSPMINAWIKKQGADDAKKFLYLCMVLFSVWPTAVDTLQHVAGREWPGLSTIGLSGSQAGYSIVNFMLVYAIGAYMGIFGQEALWGKQIGRMKLAIVFLCLAVIQLVWVEGFRLLGINGCSAWDYCNPIVILEATVLLSLAVSQKEFYSKRINRFAKAAFTAYLLHALFLPFAKIPVFVQKNPFVMLLHMLCVAVGIYLICYVVHVVYHALTNAIYRFIRQKSKAEGL